MTGQAFKNGTGAGGRVSYQPPRSRVNFPVQAPGITLAQYDDTNFGFLPLEFSKTGIDGTYHSAPYAAGKIPWP